MSTPRFVSIDLPESLSFLEFVEYGKANGANIVNGMPWSFSYKGYAVSHENDDCYVIAAPPGKKVGFVDSDGSESSYDVIRFDRYMTLHTSAAGELYASKP